MIPNIVKGGNMYGLVRYLRGEGRENEHENPHVVAGESYLMAWYGAEGLDAGSVKGITDHLEEPRRRYGTKVTAQRTEQDPDTGEKRVVGYRDAHVWHCSLSLRAGEGPLSDEQWERVAGEFMDRMGFTEASGKPPARWVAIRHGLSKNGNDHIHIAASMVREDGTRWEGRYRDYSKAQEACRELEAAHGLEPVAGPELGIAERGEKPAEQQQAARAQLRATAPKELAGRIRAAAVASSSEDEWIRRVRADGVVVKPTFARGTTDVITGYKASLKPEEYRARGTGKPGKWAFYGGGTLGRDLSLPRLRELWDEPDVDQVGAAVAEWQAAFRGQAPVGQGPEKEPVAPAAAEAAAERFTAFNEKLVMGAYDDRRAWADAARDAAGSLAAWARYDGDNAEQLRGAAAALSRSAQYKRPAAPAGAGIRPAPMGTARIFLAAAARGEGKEKIAAAVLLRQLMTTGRAVAAYHQAAGDLRQAERIRSEALARLEQVRLAGYQQLHSGQSQRGGGVAVAERPERSGEDDARRARRVAGALGGAGKADPSPLPRVLPAERPPQERTTRTGAREGGNDHERG